MSTDISRELVKPDARGTHPNSLKNLKPFPQGNRAQSTNPDGYSVSSALRDILKGKTPEGKHHAKVVAESMFDTACKPNSRGYSTALNQLLDRTEGKVPDRTVPSNVTFNITFVGRPTIMGIETPPEPLAIEGEVISVSNEITEVKPEDSQATQ